LNVRMVLRVPTSAPWGFATQTVLLLPVLSGQFS
jgi:hypothetical protein